VPGSHPERGGGLAPQTIQILEFRAHQSGALQGFATVETPSGFTIHGIAIFQQGESRWCGLPQKPRLSKGKALPAKAGGFICDPILEIQDKRRKSAFDRAVLTALDVYRKGAC